MVRNFSILLMLALILALPFAFRRDTGVRNWQPGDPVLVIISPHNEAIRHEFGLAFSRWYQQRYGKPVKVDWRTAGRHHDAE